MTKASAKFVPRSESVTDGHRPMGRINCKAARRALFDLHRDGENGLADA